MEPHPPAGFLVANVIRIVSEEVVVALGLRMILNQAFQSLVVMVVLEVDLHWALAVVLGVALVLQSMAAPT